MVRGQRRPSRKLRGNLATTVFREGLFFLLQASVKEEKMPGKGEEARGAFTACDGALPSLRPPRTLAHYALNGK